MELTTYTMTEASLQNLGNDCISIFIDALVSDECLTKEQGDKLKTLYGVVVYRKGFFGRFLDGLWGTKDETSLKVVRFGRVGAKVPTYPKLQLVQNEDSPS